MMNVKTVFNDPGGPKDPKTDLKSEPNLIPNAIEAEKRQTTKP